MSYPFRIFTLLTLIVLTCGFSEMPVRIVQKPSQENSVLPAIPEYKQITGPVRLMHNGKCFFVSHRLIGKNIDYIKNPLSNVSRLVHNDHDLWISYHGPSKGYQISVDAENTKVIGPDRAKIRKAHALVIQNNEELDSQFWDVENRGGQFMFRNKRSNFYIGATRDKMEQVMRRDAFPLTVIQFTEVEVIVITPEPTPEIIYSDIVEIGQEVIKNGTVVWVDGKGGGIVVSEPFMHSRDSQESFTDVFKLPEALEKVITNTSQTDYGDDYVPSSADFVKIRPGLQVLYGSATTQYWLRGSADEYGIIGNLSGAVEVSNPVTGNSTYFDGPNAPKCKVVKIIMFKNISDLREDGVGF